MNRSTSGIRWSFAVLLLASATLFSACGGGGGGGGGGPQAPAAPTNLKAAAVSTTEIGLAWTDASGNETEFSVERSTDGLFTGPSTTVVATLAANKISCSSTGLAPSTTYYFRVRARNTAGYSGYSNTANAATFTVSTIVGTPTTTASLSGSVDSVVGADARFYYPRGVATSPSGTIYVADTMNHTIRALETSGAVVTLAGTALASGSTDSTGAAARFNQPSGIATDGASLYVADTQNHTIRKIDISSLDVTTLAGTPLTAGHADGVGTTAEFNQPTGITISGTDLYIADTMNNTIRKISSGGTVTTIAGTALVSGSTDSIGTAALFNQPSGIATDGTNLYVADTMNHTIRKIDSVGNVTTIAGSALVSGSTDTFGTAARFNRPSGISTDGLNLFVTDSGNHTIRKIVIATGEVTTLAGKAGVPGSASGAGINATFNNPFGIAINSTYAYLYVADTNNHSIRVLNTTSAIVGPLAGYVSAGVYSPLLLPYGVTTNGTKLYVADTNNNKIQEIVISSGSTTILAGASFNGWGDGIGTAASFWHPFGIATDGIDTLYVADTLSNTIRTIVISTATVSTLAGTGGSSGFTNGMGATVRFSGPTGIAVIGNFLYVADKGNNAIRRVDRFSGVTTTLAGSGSIGSADGAGAAASFYQPFGITTDGTDLYVSEYINNTIRKVTTSGVVTTLAGTAGTSGSTDDIGAAARFVRPAGITTDNTYLYVADYGNHTIRKIDILNKVVTTLAGSAGVPGFNDTTGSAARFNHPYGVVWDSTTQSLYVADTYNSSIRKIQ